MSFDAAPALSQLLTRGTRSILSVNVALAKPALPSKTPPFSTRPTRHGLSERCRRELNPDPDSACFPTRTRTQVKVKADSDCFLKCRSCTQPVKDVIVFGSLSVQFYHRDYGRHHKQMNFPHLCSSEWI